MEKDQLISMIHFPVKREDERAQENQELKDMAKRYDNMVTVKKMKEIVPEYKSNNSLYEVLDYCERFMPR